MKRLATTFATAALVATVGASVSAAPLTLSQQPLFIATAAKPNVLLVLANSNSMDEDATGLAVGSASPLSKSEIARGVAKNLVSNYTNTLNMGLMAFQQLTTGGDPVRLYQVHSSPYDVSFDPTNYDPTYTGPRTGPKRRFRAPNVSWPGNYIYYNVNLPFYDSANDGTAFCYSRTAHAFNNGENPVSGPWDSYRCFRTKNSASDVVPANGGQEGANGWSSNFLNTAFLPTDSDLGQGITDFGSFLAWNWVSPAWFSNGSPGKGYVHVPIAFLDATQAAKFNTKLGTSQFVTNGPSNPALPLQNAGLTPLQGTLITAHDYFAGTLTDPAQGGALAAPPNSCGKNFTVVLTNGLPSVQADGTPSSDVTTMLANVAAAATSLETLHVDTYIVGFALPFGVNPNQLDTIAAAGGTSTAYSATNQTTLVDALDQIFADILRRSGAASAVALNSSSLASNSFLYQAKFDIGWAGRLLAYPIDPVTGALAGTPTWDASTVLDTMDWDTGLNPRSIITYKPSTGTGIPFRWPVDPTMPTATELDVVQTTALNTSPAGLADARGATRLNYLRGDNSLEGPTASTQFRPRNSDLGDIVDSGPFYVGAPEDNYRDPSYRLWALSPAMTSREPVIYVGANDGFLHGFRASDGQELLAYMPSPAYAAISKLTGQGYAHRYYVDASPNVADAKIGAGSTWRTMLVSGLGAGGRGVFALDVTDPSQFSEAHAAQIVKWEFTSLNDADLGYTFGRPAIVKLANGNWGAIFGNGYNNTGSGQSGIFIVDLSTGTLVRKLMTGVGSAGTPNGIGPLVVIDRDNDDAADTVYAGDLTGRLWKFDLSDPDPTNWNVAYGGAPLFRAASSQPITSAPEITRHPQGGYLLYFATGQYIDVNDPSTTNTQTLYGVWDNGTSNLQRSDLVQQSVTGVISVSGTNYRTVTSNTIDWTTKFGWYLDLPTSGERVAVDPIMRDGRIVFTTLIPDSSPCTAGGTGWLMELDFKTGGQLPGAPFDSNHDGHVDNNDAQNGGMQLSAVSSSAVAEDGKDIEHKFLNQSTGSVLGFGEAKGLFSNRRTSWIEVR